MSEERFYGPHISFWWEWDQIWHRCNWYTFTPLHVEFEWDKMLGGVEAKLVVMGFGVSLRINYAKTQELVEMVRRVDGIKGGKDV